MLLDIAKLPTAGNSAIRLHPTDNVAVARVPIPAGTELSVEGLQVTAREAIPAGHKIALRAIRAGELVERYGQAIGRASQMIAAGRPVQDAQAARFLPQTLAPAILPCREIITVVQH